jgi:hypothetical protein
LFYSLDNVLVEIFNSPLIILKICVRRSPLFAEQRGEGGEFVRPKEPNELVLEERGRGEVN